MRELLRILFFSGLKARLMILLVSLTAALFGILSPFVQKEFLEFLLKPQNVFVHESRWFSSPWLALVLSFFSLWASQILYQWTLFLGQSEANIAQHKIADRLYQKVLSLTGETLNRTPIGEVVSLYATDVSGVTILLEQTIPMGATTLIPLFLAPLVVRQYLGVPLVLTYFVLGMVILINLILARRQAYFFSVFKRLAGQRVGLVNEWIQNIRALRILSWVPAFEDKIIAKRILETDNRVRMVTNGQIMNAVSTSINFILNIIVLSFLIFYSKTKLAPADIFVLLWVLGVFLTRPFRQMPWFFTFFFDGWSSLVRLRDFFKLFSRDTQILHTSQKPDSQWAIDVQGLELQIAENKILQNIDLQIKKGEFVAIVGEVGSGKSILFQSLLFETGAVFQNYNLNGKALNNNSAKAARQELNYLPQESFLISATLRDNIVFDYDSTTSADQELEGQLKLSQFEHSEERLWDGLNTRIGERGVNLSGGQKQRVQLARLLNKNKKIFLMDDCLSALDPNTEESLIRDVLCGTLKNTTRVLITHRWTILPKVDRVLFLLNGKIHGSGTYEDLLQRDEVFKTWVERSWKK